eukprot:Plantae.Rhodophyta-Hildenbrandia_rubra.ctg38129.p1 GENE.Plantae.Rhodophyta-Hildenbrandia_rubra.ctg38129~~Plantae.Rhodophyta-Hildenbrandia_rubra.ctg38129.p1  ORF type:complete len:385 (-),score=86.61 Plantae.Rhodophyta-Hildenbrandia_rubra.ctg38129:394-1548(-)
METSTRTIVIVGGGPAGAAVLHELLQAFHKKFKMTPHFIVIDPREYWEASWASIRGMFDEKTRENMVVNLCDFVGDDSEVICGKVVKVGQGFVVVEMVKDEDGDKGRVRKEIRFDCCVLGSGSEYRGSVGVFKGEGVEMRKREVRMKGLKEMGDRVRDAENVCVVGGGAVGVEVAGEILDWMPGKKVLLVHKGKRLMDAYNSEKASRIIKDRLEKMGCVVLLGEEVEEMEDGTLKGAASGEVYKADLVFKCLGVSPNSDYMPKDKLDGRGFIDVDEFFRVKGMSNVFALGDCCNASAKKLVAEIGFQNKTVAANVVETLVAASAKKEAKLSKYSPGPNIICTVLGRKAGVATTPVGATTLILPFIKNRNLFVSMQKSRSGIPTK